MILQDIAQFLQNGGLHYLVIVQTRNGMEQYLGRGVSVLTVSELRSIVRRRYGFPVGYQRVALDLTDDTDRMLITAMIREQCPQTEIF